jgi:protein O-GlcNAc transferase
MDHTRPIAAPLPMSDPTTFREPDLPPAIEYAAACYEEGRLDEAAAVCAEFLESYPSHFDALHLAGVIKIAQGEPAAAVTLLTEAVKVRPRAYEAALNLAVALQDTGDAVGALIQSDRALALNPDFPEAFNSRGNALRALGRPEEALSSYERALGLRFDYPDALSNRGAALTELGRAEEALASCERALNWQPDLAEAHFNRGNALRALGRHMRALASYEEALEIRPGYRAALANRIAIYMLLDRSDQALAAARAAFDRDPSHMDALVECTVAAHKRGHSAAALAALEDALTAVPKHGGALRTRAGILRDLGRHAEALSVFESAIEAEEDDAGALAEAAFAALALCDWEKSERLTPEILRRVEAGAAVPPYVLLHLTDRPKLHAEGAASYAKREFAAVPPLPLMPVRPDGRIHIAYVAADFDVDPIGLRIAELVEHHQRARFEVHGVAFGAEDRGRGRRARNAGAFDRFHVVRGESDAVRRMRDLAIDIAIDLSGYAPGGQPGIFAGRAAPVQVGYLGYPGSMGAEFMDYIIADPIVLPLDEAPTPEKIIHLPDCYQAIDAGAESEGRSPFREKEGLPEEDFVFCCFGDTFTIRRPMFEIWMRLLAAVPASVLWLLRGSDAACDRLRREAAARCIDPARLVFADRVAPGEHLARLELADLVLDTLPYNAQSAAADSLRAGVPVLTCRGQAFPGRVGASLLTAAGLAELVAPDLAAYEAQAVRLAKEPEIFHGLRRRLVENQAKAPLFAVERFCRRIEDAYTQIHALRRKGEAPRSIAIPAQ